MTDQETENERKGKESRWKWNVERAGSTYGKMWTSLHQKSQMQDLCQPEGQTDSLNPREQTSLYLAKQQVLCHVSQTSLTVHPTQDNTLCSLPTELINTGCRNVQKLISHGTNPCGTSWYSDCAFLRSCHLQFTFFMLFAHVGLTLDWSKQTILNASTHLRIWRMWYSEWLLTHLSTQSPRRGCRTNKQSMKCDLDECLQVFCLRLIHACNRC